MSCNVDELPTLDQLLVEATILLSLAGMEEPADLEDRIRSFSRQEFCQDAEDFCRGLRQTESPTLDESASEILPLASLDDGSASEILALDECGVCAEDECSAVPGDASAATTAAAPPAAAATTAAAEFAAAGGSDTLAPSAGGSGTGAATAGGSGTGAATAAWATLWAGRTAASRQPPLRPGLKLHDYARYEARHALRTSEHQSGTTAWEATWLKVLLHKANMGPEDVERMRCPFECGKWLRNAGSGGREGNDAQGCHVVFELEYQTGGWDLPGCPAGVSCTNPVPLHWGKYRHPPEHQWVVETTEAGGVACLGITVGCRHDNLAGQHGGGRLRRATSCLVVGVGKLIYGRVGGFKRGSKSTLQPAHVHLFLSRDRSYVHFENQTGSYRLDLNLATDQDGVLETLVHANLVENSDGAYSLRPEKMFWVWLQPGEVTGVPHSGVPHLLHR